MEPIDEIGDDEEGPHEYASPACLMHEVDPAYSMGVPRADQVLDAGSSERRLRDVTKRFEDLKALRKALTDANVRKPG